ncbi:MAG: CopD family protein [Gammaproteobacteria bacterium]|nr:CopD family protein [Gammaproteobacteria bacterium]
MGSHVTYLAVTLLHILAAMMWVGSLLFMSLLLVPSLRAMKDPPLMARLIQTVGTRYRVAGWISLGVLLVTGCLALSFRGIGHEVLLDMSFWSTPFGETLGWKLLLFVGVVLLSAAHDVMSGPKLRRLREEDPAAAERQRRMASWMGRITLILTLGIVVFAVMLVRGRPW